MYVVIAYKSFRPGAWQPSGHFHVVTLTFDLLGAGKIVHFVFGQWPRQLGHCAASGEGSRTQERSCRGDENQRAG